MNKRRVSGGERSGGRKKGGSPVFSGFIGAASYVLFVLSISLVLTIITVFAANDVLAFVKEDAEIVVELPEDASLGDISKVLQENGVIRYKSLFTLFQSVLKLEDGYAPGGEYVLNAKYDYRALISILRTKRRDTVTLVFPEGYTTKQIVELLASKNVCKEEELWEAVRSYNFKYDFLQDLEKGDRRLEGYLYPDTYEFYVEDETAVNVLVRFLSNFDKKLTDSMRELVEESGYSLHEILTIASLIEREAKLPEEQAIISGVIQNRLKSSQYPYLEIDATVQYVLGHKEALTTEDLAVDDPYNTYKYKGLPPGPIANPGFGAIVAALNPAKHDYYFYVAKPDGNHIFSKTLEEHNQAKAQVKALQN